MPKKITKVAQPIITVNQNRLVRKFLQLVKIASPSGEEEQVANYIREELDDLGIKYTTDKKGNLIARVSGASTSPLLLCAHMDTVLPGINIQPVTRGNTIMSGGQTILGADDKLGIAYILELLQLLHETKSKHRPLELIFSVCEEDFSQGTTHLDFSKLLSPWGIVLDGGDAGHIYHQAQYLAELNIAIKGKEAHSGAEPELGINAIVIAAEALTHMKFGKIDAHTTANIGTIHGGSNRNVVPGLVTLIGEVRSFSKAKLEVQIDRIHTALQDAAEAHGGLLSIDSKVVLAGYDFPKTDPVIEQIAQALKMVKLKPKICQALGASDANVFIANGIKAFNIGTGVRHPHTVEEQVDIPDMVKMVQFLLEMVIFKRSL